jgi:signal transduction histidine kinase
MDFITHIAHEIKTPLTLIKAPMEKILMQAASFPSIEKYLLSMNRNTNRLLSLANQLLDFRKIESDHFMLNPTLVNITELAKNICANFQSIAEERNKQLQLIINEPVFANLDEEATTKIMNNLLDNALKYGKHTVTVNVLPAHQEEKFVTIAVSNDGNMIPESYHEKIFEPYFRLKDSDKASGTGIGLSLARSLAQLQNGNLILVAKNGLNTFIVTFPIT